MARSRALALALLLPLTAVGAACRPAEADAPPPPAPAGAGPEAGKPDPAAAADWKRVDQLISDQKLAEAAQDLEKLEAGARARHDDHELARVLIRETQVGLALGGYETAVEALAAKDWPAAPLARAAVELYQAHALLGYLNAYGWEIARREKVVSGEQLDLKLWTARPDHRRRRPRVRRRLVAARRPRGRSLQRDFEYLAPNTYPASGSGRPCATPSPTCGRAAGEHLATGPPPRSQETWKLDLGTGLVAGTGVEPTAERLSDPGLHPLAKLAAILGDLERWHRSRGEAGARARSPLGAAGRPLLRARPSRRIGRRSGPPSAARSTSSAATPGGRWARRAGPGCGSHGPEPDAAVRAREIALAGERADPGTPGAAACRHLLESIEAPSFDLHVDEPGRRRPSARWRSRIATSSGSGSGPSVCRTSASPSARSSGGAGTRTASER